MVKLFVGNMPEQNESCKWDKHNRSSLDCACLSGTYSFLLIDMADEMADQQSIKKSKGFLKHLKKLFQPGSQSAPLSHSNTSPTIASPAGPLPPANLTTVTTITTNPEEAAKLRAKYTNFRILVIGRANAGKTTLLKRVCNTMEDPVYSKVR